MAATALVVPGLFTTIALPAYAETPGSSTMEAPQVVHPVAVQTQTVVVADSVAAVAVSRDSFGATSEAELAARAAAKAKAAAEAKRAQVAAVRAAQAARAARVVRVSRSSPRALAVASNAGAVARVFAAPAPRGNLGGIVGVASRYAGVPYVFGGASPSGFDCSGFTQFVFGQFGISLPHSAAAQGRMGTTIPTSQGRPGDLVAMNDGSHVGIYLGGGRMIDAPMPGRTVSARAIWTSSYHIVRFS